jgi:3-hydroxyisobutyrate dehydrogenase-like beta-hydroxyacid dehydrogenase
VYGKLIASKGWDSGGATAIIGLKDADLAIEAGAAANLPLPSVHIWRAYLERAIERGEGHLDWAVMAKEQARAAGLQD